jgi:4-hydroxy 2-oxovalerate aldolase
LKIIDCTLRDGGYWLNWNWPVEVYREVFNALYACVEIVESGYINRYIEPKDIRKIILEAGNRDYCLSSKYYGLMADWKDYQGMIIDESQMFCNCMRIAIKESEFESSKGTISECFTRTPPFTNQFLNLMQVHFVSDDRLVEIAKWAGTLPIRAMYLADSFGMMTIEDIEHAYNLVKEYVPAVGIHLHNNRGDADGKLLECAKIGFDWADTSILGMGRGAGNADTCKIATVSPNAVNLIQNMKDHFQWGPSEAYKVAANLGIHPLYVQYGMTVEQLMDLPVSKRRGYDADLCKQYKG